jgi:hypothetical protein
MEIPRKPFEVNDLVGEVRSCSAAALSSAPAEYHVH